jgi:tubulin polyglutamylase TTLL4
VSDLLGKSPALLQKDIKLRFCISPSTEEYNALIHVLRANGFARTESPHSSNLYWSKPLKNYSHLKNRPFQKLNHFPGSDHLANKALLALNVHKFQQCFPGEFDFLPQSFVLPSQYSLLREAMNADSRQIWIFKPAQTSCGHGIVLVKNINEIPEFASNAVVSRYVMNPFLINGHKFDLRIYVVVTSVDPLRVYMFDDGLVRFASMPYSHCLDNLKEMKIHLTNFSVNKDNRVRSTVESLHEPEFTAVPNEVENKWSLLKLWDYLSENGHNVDSIIQNIQSIVSKTFISCAKPVIDTMRRVQCPQ